MALVTIQPLTELSTRNPSSYKGPPARKDDNLTAICRLSRICGSLAFSQLCGPLRPVAWTALAREKVFVRNVEYHCSGKQNVTTLQFMVS
jgi:hypothetical protein